ncbi:hypothetical protein EYZ11_007503 [Aspergillus tanneri]|uniref:Hydrophobin n=1 Tax=Aspergillus tanneri TaxID=1220188 RepID=A0A4S3JIH5_9EURO|nr:uncharacterized protein ATNIH1004_004271 [Aspergillus tanneri]KAA8648386.1 hypothetical protein ATNIH1004_004271 [Aspergillus tanneri]THC93021.1 hypothetical protein EYZ11_007503 [Aspergillus tanneri]
MKFATTFSLLVAGSAMVSALPSSQSSEGQTSSGGCQGPLLCCGTLTTPLDTTLDPILKVVGVDAANIVGSVGLLCHPHDETCSSAPQCCTEANLLGGTLALGCSASK